MKHEFPSFQSKVNLYLVMPVIMITVSFFNYYAAFKPTKEVYTMVFTFFGVTGALAGLCFAMAPSKKEEPNIRYAGEKLMHSSVLLVQTIILLFTKNSLLEMPIIKGHLIPERIIFSLFLFMILIVSIMASVTWYHGLQRLNSELWDRYRKRIDIKNKKTELK